MGKQQTLRKQLQHQLGTARSYEQWLVAAEAIDELDGMLLWREQPDTQLLHEPLIREHLETMRHCRRRGDTLGLTRVLQESLYRHQGELANPDLYAVALTGTKQVVTEFLDEVECSMRFICDQPMPGVSPEHKLNLFRKAEQVYGRPALMLSGGAAFGVYHLGVTRALWQQDLLPDVIAGASMGAIVAGAICCRNDAELADFFQHPNQIDRQAFQWLRPDRIWRQGYAMDQAQLQRHIRANLGSRSFKEAYQHSGRMLNISVSPTRTRQKPRLLNELASPDVLVESAVLASCAVPGIYPPVTLQARDFTRGNTAEAPYMPTESWIDGSVHGDLPLMRMARLHNVNKTIVSQANPHVLPFLSPPQKRGAKASLKQAAVSLMRGQLATTLKLTPESGPSSILRPFLEQAHAMASQSYLGDINIYFPMRPMLYRKVLANPTPEDIDMYIHLGEQATWPKLAMIRDQTRINRAFTDCIRHLKLQAGVDRNTV
ncbi:patatin-like phospholipase family protein [Marinobacter caseinilyticus]|uniref:patatin-like phospholipase family protein n=1 Tax=Marinobacter caseinilyticus TaxID=2692195 RepID=UPI00140AE44E|nr:patatin-like phospholipase family protein [Marinobacter caseinilyticus]